MLVIGAAGSSATAGTACTGVALSPGDNVPAAVRTAAAGTSFCLAPGTYRLAEPVRPLDGDRLIGPGAVLDGTVAVSSWAAQSPVWTAAWNGAPTYNDNGWGNSPQANPQALYLDDLLMDGAPLWKVGVRTGGAVVGDGPTTVGPGEYFVDYDNDRITMGSDPAGHRMSMTSVPMIVSGRDRANVELDGLTLLGAAGTGVQVGDSWLVDGVTARANHLSGIDLIGDGSVIRASLADQNGKYGISGAGRNHLVEGNEVSRNNTAGFGVDGSNGCGSAGGSKFVNTTNLVVRHNDYHDNFCNGIWLDINNVDSLITENRTTGNDGSGIRVEISYRATISKNVVVGNHGIGIVNNNSPDVTVTGNLLVRNGGGSVRFIQSDRTGDHPSSLGDHVVTGFDVRGNVATLLDSSERVGGGDQIAGEPSFDAAADNRFAGNTYLTGSASQASFLWANRMAFTGWQSIPQDGAGRVYGLDTRGPSAPGAVTRTATQTGLTVSWAAASDETLVALYQVRMDGAIVQIGPGTSYSLSGAECGETHSFQVTALDGAANASPAATFTAGTTSCTDTTPPTAPVNLVQAGSSTSSVSLQWGAASDDVGVTGYRVSLDGVVLGDTTATAFTVTGLGCDETHAVDVAAVDAAGNASPTASLTARTAVCPDVQAPSVPSGLTRATVSETGFAVAWSPSTDDRGVAGYQVILDGVSAGTTQGITFAAGGLSCGTSHTVAVRAFDVAGNVSAVSAPLVVQTTACPVTVTGLGAAPASFTTQTTISYALNRQASVTIEIVKQSTGKVVRHLVTGATRAAGTSQAVWNGMNDAGRPVQRTDYTVVVTAGCDGRTDTGRIAVHRL
jgi:hypothetical protein